MGFETYKLAKTQVKAANRVKSLSTLWPPHIGEEFASDAEEKFGGRWDPGLISTYYDWSQIYDDDPTQLRDEMLHEFEGWGLTDSNYDAVIAFAQPYLSAYAIARKYQYSR